MARQTRETHARHLSFESDFREWLHQHKELPKIVTGMAGLMFKKGDTRCERGICVTCIDVNRDDTSLLSRSFKVAVGKDNFFLKLEKHIPDHEGGFHEMQDTLLAKDVLTEASVKGVRVTQSLLGYSDTQRRNYYVAEWVDLPVLDDVMADLKNSKQERQYSKLLDRVKQIQAVLVGYQEISPANMFYDEVRDEIVMFDMHL